MNLVSDPSPYFMIAQPLIALWVREVELGNPRIRFTLSGVCLTVAERKLSVFCRGGQYLLEINSINEWILLKNDPIQYSIQY